MAYLKEIDLLSLTDYKLFIIFPDKKKEKERLDFIDFYQQWPSFFWNHCDTIWKWKKSENVNHSVVSDFLKPMDCSPPVSSVLGILQARILEWVAISFSRGSSWPRDWTLVSCIAGRFFTVWATREMSGDSDKNNFKHHWSPTEFPSMMYHEILPGFDSHNNMKWWFGHLRNA